eukprot:1365580-Amorphochlora_amoeboformis.AAC.1
MMPAIAEVPIPMPAASPEPAPRSAISPSPPTRLELDVYTSLNDASLNQLIAIYFTIDKLPSARLKRKSIRNLVKSLSGHKKTAHQYKHRWSFLTRDLMVWGPGRSGRPKYDTTEERLSSFITAVSFIVKNRLGRN